MKRNRLQIVLIPVTAAILLTGCGKKENGPSVRYEVVDGQIVQITDGVQTGISPSAVGMQQNAAESRPGMSGRQENSDISGDVFGNMAGEYFSPGEYSPSTVSDGVAISFPDELYNTLALVDSVKMETLKSQLNAAADAVREVYSAAEKGETYNVSLSDYAVLQMVNTLGAAGFPAVDSERMNTMAGYAAVDEFGGRVPFGENISTTYYVVYRDGHMSQFHLYRENRQWHLISMSMAWNDDLSPRIYSEGRYALGSVVYTEKGWLIYTRDTSDFDENQKANTDQYTMVRVLPQDTQLRDLCKKYIEPIGYFENNVFTCDWSEQNFSALDFNSVYAYTFQISNGTEQMLSAYNIRNYYKLYQGSNLYFIPAKYYEENTLTRFNINISSLRTLAGYDPQEDGYYFLPYSHDYYNVTPRTPFPEVISAVQNADGTITMTVDAVNAWYGTDRAFTHVVTVRPKQNGQFVYVSNHVIPSEKNVLPEQKIAARRAAEYQAMREKR